MSRSFTNNFHLCKPPIHDNLNWGNSINNNFKILDKELIKIYQNIFYLNFNYTNESKAQQPSYYELYDEKTESSYVYALLSSTENKITFFDQSFFTDFPFSHNTPKEYSFKKENDVFIGEIPNGISGYVLNADIGGTTGEVEGTEFAGQIWKRGDLITVRNVNNYITFLKLSAPKTCIRPFVNQGQELDDIVIKYSLETLSWWLVGISTSEKYAPLKNYMCTIPTVFTSFELPKKDFEYTINLNDVWTDFDVSVNFYISDDDQVSRSYLFIDYVIETINDKTIKIIVKNNGNIPDNTYCDIFIGRCI